MTKTYPKIYGIRRKGSVTKIVKRSDRDRDRPMRMDDKNYHSNTEGKGSKELFNLQRYNPCEYTGKCVGPRVLEFRMISEEEEVDKSLSTYSL